MKVFLFCFFFMTSIFYIEYKDHYWNPCGPEGNCLSIYCSDVRGCYSPGTKIFCLDEQCVKEILNKQGEDHLGVIYRIRFEKYNRDPIIERMVPVPSYNIILETE